MESTKYYLGLDVGGTNMVAGVVDENHQIIAKESIPTQAGRTIEEITTDMAEVSKKAVLKAGLQMEDISSWGIGMPSYVNPKTNLLVHANCFGWKNVPIYDYLKKHISLPTYIANDANCATYGEVLAGSASQYTDAIMLTLGTGVGGRNYRVRRFIPDPIIWEPNSDIPNWYTMANAAHAAKRLFGSLLLHPPH